MTSNATGNTVTLIDASTVDDINETRATVLADGGWVVTWTVRVYGEEEEDDTTASFQQRFNAAGEAIGDATQVNDPSDTSIFSTMSTPLADGGWVTVFQAVGAEGYGIYQIRFDAEGARIGAETRIDSDASSGRSSPSITTLDDGGWVVSWGGSSAVFQQRFDADGTEVGGETQASPSDLFFPSSMSVVGLADGGWVTFWMFFDDSTARDVFQQRFDADGSPVGDATLVNTTLSNNQDGHVAVALADGGWVVIWESLGQDGGDRGVYQQHYDSGGNRVGVETLVNTTTDGSQTSPSVTALADGGWVVVWQSHNDDQHGIYLQRYGSDGNAVGTETQVGADQEALEFDPVVAALPGGGWVVTWISASLESPTGSVQQRVFAVDVEGTSGADTLNGTAFDETLNGGAGADLMEGGTGNDIYVVDDAGDAVVEAANAGTDTVRSSITQTLGANVENLVLTDTGNLNGTGNALANTMTGNSGNNILNGRGGADTMAGLAGNDTYIVDSLADVVVEAVGNGTDTVQTAVSLTLGDNVENLTLLGTGNLNGTGNALANTMRGNSGNNILNGRGGADTMTGLAGNDTYIVDSLTDVVVEAVGNGTDTVQTAVNWTLGDNFENLTLLGTGNLNGTGNALANTMRGNSGNNILNGRAGADTMAGLAGNDTYIVDSLADVVVEAAGNGTDTVLTAVNWTLGDNFENLTLLGTGNLNGTGNGLANIMTGNSGNNILNGRAGADTMAGLAGNDTYVVDSLSDVVVEAAGNGTDTVLTAVNWTLGDNFENLTLLGTGNLNGTGNGLANIMTGNSGNNILNGRAGADTMAGLAGNDTYVVDSVADVVTEAAGQGTDTVLTAVNWTLGNNFENLTLLGSGNINGVGNALNNLLTGNTGNNILNGVGGNDTIIGGAGADRLFGGFGNDTLTGGTGADTFVFHSTPNAATNVDEITDFSVAADTIALENSVFTTIGAVGTLAASAFERNTTGLAQDASDRIIYETDTGNLFYDSNGNAAGGSVLIAVLDPGLLMTNLDFTVI